jgi:hypothetical protein
MRGICWIGRLAAGLVMAMTKNVRLAFDRVMPTDHDGLHFVAIAMAVEWVGRPLWPL